MRKILQRLMNRTGRKDLRADQDRSGESRKELIRQAVSRTVREYGDVLKRLGSE